MLELAARPLPAADFMVYPLTSGPLRTPLPSTCPTNTPSLQPDLPSSVSNERAGSGKTPGTQHEGEPRTSTISPSVCPPSRTPDPRDTANPRDGAGRGRLTGVELAPKRPPRPARSMPGPVVPPPGGGASALSARCLKARSGWRVLRPSGAERSGAEQGGGPAGRRAGLPFLPAVRYWRAALRGSWWSRPPSAPLSAPEPGGGGGGGPPRGRGAGGAMGEAAPRRDCCLRPSRPRAGSVPGVGTWRAPRGEAVRDGAGTAGGRRWGPAGLWAPDRSGGRGLCLALLVPPPGPAVCRGACAGPADKHPHPRAPAAPPAAGTHVPVGCSHRWL